MNAAEAQEHAVIGAAILGGDRHGTVDLSPADFSDPKLGKVWAEIQKESVVDTSALAHLFGESFISDFIGCIPTSGSILTAAEKVKGFAFRRRLVRDLAAASKQAEHANLDELAQFVMRSIDNAPKAKEAKHIREFAIEAYQHIVTVQESGQPINFIPTGFRDFDEKIGGLQKDGLIIVAGRPSMGKTAFAMGVARNASRSRPVLAVSMEMSGEQLAMRLLAAERGVDLQAMMQGKLGQEDWRKLAGASETLCDSNLYINEIPRRSINDIAAECRRFKRVHDDLGLVVIDYLGLMDMPKGERRDLTIGEVTRQCKLLAKEISCPIVLLCQLNRKLEERKDKRPLMSDLRDSGDIEADADQILFPFRLEVYSDDPADKGVAEIIVAKNRNGKTGRVMMTWLASSTSFVDATKGAEW